MLDSLEINNKKAVARILLGILGIKFDGRISTKEPDIYNIFVDLFYTNSQEEILPIFQDVVNISQGNATAIIASLSNKDKDEIRRYLVDRSDNNAKVILATALLMQSIGFNLSYFQQN